MNKEEFQDFKDSFFEWVGILLPIILLVIGLVLFNRWAGNQAKIKEEQNKARQEKLMSTPSKTPSYHSTSSPTSDYVDSHGSDDCTDDCSGHEAGYEWAEDNEVCDTDYSDSYSDSFNEGVVAWSEDNC